MVFAQCRVGCLISLMYSTVVMSFSLYFFFFIVCFWLFFLVFDSSCFVDVSSGVSTESALVVRAVE